MAHEHDHDHGHSHSHGHGHAEDQGLSGALRYLRFAPRMWSSSINDAVIDLVAPQSGETVVDIGAGMGPAVVAAAARGATVIAVEPTPFLRRILASRRLTSRHRKAITVASGSAEALPVGTGQANAVWAVNTMHHWVDPAAGVREVARVLAPGGRAVLIDEDFADPRHPDSERWGQDHGTDDQNDHNHDDHHHGFSMVDAAEFGELLTDAGLVDVVAEKRDLAGVPVIAVLAKASG